MSPSDSELRFDTGEAEARAYSEPIPQHQGDTPQQLIDMVKRAEEAIAKRTQP